MTAVISLLLCVQQQQTEGAREVVWVFAVAVVCNCFVVWCWDDFCCGKRTARTVWRIVVGAKGEDRE